MEIKRTPELKGKDAVRFLKRISKNESKRASKREVERVLKSAMGIATMRITVSTDKKNQMKGKKITSNCPILAGFEIYFTGERDEKKARKKLLPLIKELYEHGKLICDCGKTSSKKVIDINAGCGREFKGGRG